MYNNNYFKKSLNKIHFLINDFLMILFFKNRFNTYHAKKHICPICHRVHLKNSKYCSKRCSRLAQEESYQVFKHNNNCHKHKHQNLTYKNICWDCYKDKFAVRSISIKYRLLLWLMGYRVFYTYRTSTESWNGDKAAFEQSLLDKNVRWFSYVKFYVKGNKAIPLVGGKSGSLKVNASGSDLNFSIKGGPARDFLTRNRYKWCYDFIMIKKSFTEKSAYRNESKINRKLDLFDS